MYYIGFPDITRTVHDIRFLDDNLLESIGRLMVDLSTDEKTYELLREKIKSKMDVTKFFSGFVSVVFGIILKDTISGVYFIRSQWKGYQN